MTHSLLHGVGTSKWAKSNGVSPAPLLVPPNHTALPPVQARFGDSEVWVGGKDGTVAVYQLAQVHPVRALAPRASHPVRMDGPRWESLEPWLRQYGKVCTFPSGRYSSDYNRPRWWRFAKAGATRPPAAGFEVCQTKPPELPPNDTFGEAAPPPPSCRQGPFGPPQGKELRERQRLSVAMHDSVTSLCWVPLPGSTRLQSLDSPAEHGRARGVGRRTFLPSMRGLFTGCHRWNGL